MSKYITLVRFTDKGAAEIKESISRARTFDDAAEASGVRIVGQYWTMGSYDGVLIIEAETEQKALHCLTTLAAGGNVRTETMQAFEADEFAQILG